MSLAQSKPRLRMVEKAEWERSAKEIQRAALIHEASLLLPATDAERVLRGVAVELELPDDLPEAEQSQLAARWFAFCGELQRWFREHGPVRVETEEAA